MCVSGGSGMGGEEAIGLHRPHICEKAPADVVGVILKPGRICGQHV